MINLENRIERDELIDDYFNKGYACNIREVYQAIVNTIADLEYANDEKIKEIERLNKMLDEKFMKENTFLVENGIICTKNKEIERLTELCNKYEEEHKTAFETWQKDIKENDLLHSIIKEVREKLDTQLAFTSSYQLNYQSAMSIIEEAKSILNKESK